MDLSGQDKAGEIALYFDPVCPLAWITSKWVRSVTSCRPVSVDWKFISLRLINSGVDYQSHFPHTYEDGHAEGLRATKACDEHGRHVIGPLHEGLGARIFDSGPGNPRRTSAESVAPTLAPMGPPASLAQAVDDLSWYPEILAGTDEALDATGRDVGTPIIHLSPPTGTAFLGPVLSRLPHEEDSVRLWDDVNCLAGFVVKNQRSGCPLHGVAPPPNRLKSLAHSG